MLTCFLCKKGINVKLGAVTKFTKASLYKCRKILAIRKEKDLNYQETVLPERFQQNGYHTDCFIKFTVLKSIDIHNYDVMFSNKIRKCNNGLVTPINNIDSPTNVSKDTPTTTCNTQDCVEIEVPELVDIKMIDTATEEPINTNDIILEIPVTKEPINTNDFILKIPVKKEPADVNKNPLGYQIDEPSYAYPDISKGVILKSILTRKSPVKRDMTQDSVAFNYGMDLMMYGTDLNQPNFNSATEELEAKILPPVVGTGVCLICNKEQRKIGRMVQFPQVLSKKLCHKKVLPHAKVLADNNMIQKLYTTNIFSFHPLCIIEYKSIHKKISKRNCDDEDLEVLKNLQDEVFESLCAYIDKEIIDKNKTIFLTDLLERYKLLLREFLNVSNALSSEDFNINLQEKIIRRYSGIIEISSSKLGRRKEVHKIKNNNLECAVSENENLKYDKLAFELHGVVKAMKRTADVSEQDQIPEKLLRFISNLIQGPDARNDSYENQVKINSVCADIVAQINKK